MKRKYIKENFEKIVKISKTKKEVCIRLGLNKTGGGILTVNKYLKLYNIDISHFEYKKRNQYIKKDIKEILTEKSDYVSSNHLKERLYKEGLKERKCEICGQDENWNGKHMSLILDHINGINDDNRIENLKIVCPNCNATLETHCRGNIKNRINRKKEEKRCLGCYEIMNFQSKTGLCKKCYDLKQRKVINRPDIDDLLKDIDEYGYEGTGRKYNVSGNNVKKWIKKYGYEPPKLRKKAK